MPKLSCSGVKERKTLSLNEICTYLSRNRRESINHEFWMKMFCLVAITSTFPKAGMTASKLVPRKDGVPWVSKLFQINLTFLDVSLVISVSKDIFLVFSFFYVFFLFCFFLISLLRG